MTGYTEPSIDTLMSSGLRNLLDKIKADRTMNGVIDQLNSSESTLKTSMNELQQVIAKVHGISSELDIDIGSGTQDSQSQLKRGTCLIQQ